MEKRGFLAVPPLLHGFASFGRYPGQRRQSGARFFGLVTLHIKTRVRGSTELGAGCGKEEMKNNKRRHLEDHFGGTTLPDSAMASFLFLFSSSFYVFWASILGFRATNCWNYGNMVTVAAMSMTLMTGRGAVAWRWHGGGIGVFQ